MNDEFEVMFLQMTRCAVSDSDILWSVTVSAGSEAEAIETAIEQARAVNRRSGMPPYGIQVSEQELRQMARVVPRRIE